MKPALERTLGRRAFFPQVATKGTSTTRLQPLPDGVAEDAAAALSKAGPLRCRLVLWLKTALLAWRIIAAKNRDCFGK